MPEYFGVGNRVCDKLNWLPGWVVNGDSVNKLNGYLDYDFRNNSHNSFFSIKTIEPSNLKN